MLSTVRTCANQSELPRAIFQHRLGVVASARRDEQRPAAILDGDQGAVRIRCWVRKRPFGERHTGWRRPDRRVIAIRADDLPGRPVLEPNEKIALRACGPLECRRGRPVQANVILAGSTMPNPDRAPTPGLKRTPERRGNPAAPTYSVGGFRIGKLADLQERIIL